MNTRYCAKQKDNTTSVSECKTSRSYHATKTDSAKFYRLFFYHGLTVHNVPPGKTRACKR